MNCPIGYLDPGPILRNYVLAEKVSFHPFFIGLLHMLSLLQIPLRMSSCFFISDEKVLFQPLLKDIGEQPTFQNGDFLDTFSPKIKEGAWDMVRMLKKVTFQS
jgi:hypothetical protein